MATNTYVALKSTTLTSATGIVTFDLAGISGYTDLRIVVSARGTTTAYCAPNIQFNSDTSPSGTNYSWTAVFGDGSSHISYRVSNQYLISGEQIPRSNDTAGLFGLVTFDIMNYSNSTTHKTVLVRNSSLGSTCVTLAAVGLWRAASPTPITYITITSGTPNFEVGSTFTVYGIANADNFVKATGGIISEDSSYTYHVFGSTGTFTPKQSLTADILVVAGGGGGNDGGGGAGGVAYYAAQSLTATAYTCTVGSGGAGSSSVDGASGVNSSFTGLTAAVGGGGGRAYNVGNGTSGGSGGGAPRTASGTATGGAATSGQGYAGGNSVSGSNVAGGGGGAGGAGVAGTGTYPSGVGGTGGAGTNAYASWLTATSLGVNGYIAGGGAGFSHPTQALGSNGGGNASTNTLPATSGAQYTGSGGGAAAGGGSSTGHGGSGVVIVRYAK